MKRYEVGYVVRKWAYVDANSPEEAAETIKREMGNTEIVEVNELDETALSLLLEKIRTQKCPTRLD